LARSSTASSSARGPEGLDFGRPLGALLADEHVRIGV
jgi:hypothetical protein